MIVIVEENADIKNMVPVSWNFYHDHLSMYPNVKLVPLRSNRKYTLSRIVKSHF